jgi:hypothetical protein
MLQFSIFEKISGLKHAVTTREGGVSDGEFASLNLAFHVGDKIEKVRENRRILARQLDFNFEKLVAAQQIHSEHAEIIHAKDAGRGALDWESAVPNTDALVTAETNLPLLILVADCAPIVLVDPDNRVLALVHAGWRGAVAQIASKTVTRMQNEFRTLPENVFVGIGPCLSVENLEIGPEVAEKIAAVDSKAIVSGWEKPHLDLRGLIERDLTCSGVQPHNIEIMPFCSRDDGRFFSHRGQNGSAGRFGIVAWWEK